MKSGKNKFLILGLLSIIIIATGWFLVNSNYSHTKPFEQDTIITNPEKKVDSSEFSTEFLKAVISDEDSNEQVIRVSNPKDLDVPYQIDDKAGKSIRRIFSGRRINIAITGVDSRLGTNTRHADANHILSILIDSGRIEIYSIPRDTPADAGYDDTTGQNKLTVVRAAKGKHAYLKEAARIAGLDRIHYSVEIGFSQAMGILEWLGFRETGSALQVLRSRTGLGGDDYQRTYNQAQFIRQMILKHFKKFTGLLGDMLLRGSLLLVESDIPSSTAGEIIKKLESTSFPRSPDDITVRIRPPISVNYKVYDFTDKKVVQLLRAKIESFNRKNIDSSDSTHHGFSESNIVSRLNFSINKASSDSLKNPGQVISRLRTYFDQRAWLQVSDSSKRANIRERIQNLLCSAYLRKKQNDNAVYVKKVVDAEKLLFSNTVGKQSNNESTR